QFATQSVRFFALVRELLPSLSEFTHGVDLPVLGAPCTLDSFLGSGCSSHASSVPIGGHFRHHSVGTVDGGAVRSPGCHRETPSNAPRTKQAIDLGSLSRLDPRLCVSGRAHCSCGPRTG